MQNLLEITSIEQLRKVNQDLQICSVNFKGEKITCGDAEIILKMTRSNTLIVLNLDNNVIEKEAIKIISTIIKINNNIQEIAISMNEKIPVKIISLMPSLKYLPKLKIFRCNQNYLGDFEIEFIANILSSGFMSLDLFSMSHNNVDVSGVSEIAKIIKHNPFLKELKLDSNYLTDYDVSILGPSISTLTHLLYLDVRNNKINDEGAEVLYNSVIPSDVTINLEGNPISPKKLDELKQQLALRSRLTFLKR